MRTLNPTLKTRLSSGTTSLCHIFTVTRTDGVVKRFTNLDKDLVVGAETFESSDSITITAVSSAANNGIQAANAAFIYSDSGIAELDVIRGVYDSAEIEIALIDYNATNLGRIILLSGVVGSIEGTNKNMGRFEIKGLLNKGDARIGEYYSASCRADLGDSRCTVALGAFTKTGVVDTVSTFNKLNVILSEDVADGFFSFGVITWTSGLNDGVSMEVLNQFNAGAGKDTLILALSMPNPISPGDTFEIVAGCDKRIATCISKFNNVANFRGEPFVPGGDVVNDLPITDAP